MTSKLISCLSVLSKEEWMSFRKYLLMKTGIESDNFLLFKVLQKRKMKLADMKNADKIWQEEFSHMSQKVFANLLSRVTLWLEEWLVIFDAQSNTYQQKVQLVAAYNKRGLYNLANQVYAKTCKQLEKHKSESLERDDVYARLHKEQYYSDNPIKYSLGAELLERVVHSYAVYNGKLSSLYLSELFNWGAIQNVDYLHEKGIVNQMIIQDKVTEPYIWLNKLIQDNDPQYLHLISDKILDGDIQEGSISHTILLAYCLNYYSRLFLQGKINNPKLLLILYKHAIKTGALFTNGKIPIRRFHNIVNAISTCVSKKECDDFIHKWADLVSAKDVDSSRQLALALSSFNYQEYGQIISLLQGLKYEDLVVKLRAYSLLVLGFYEEGDSYHDILINHIFNYKRQLKRQKSNISNKVFQAYKNYYDLIEKLATWDRSKIKTIDLKEYPYLLYRSWANNKINNLT